MSEITRKKRVLFRADVPEWDFINDPDRRAAMCEKVINNLFVLKKWSSIEEGEKLIALTLKNSEEYVIAKLEKIENLKAQLEFIKAYKAGKVAINEPAKGVDL